MSCMKIHRKFLHDFFFSFHFLSFVKFCNHSRSAQLDESSGFDEKEIDGETNLKVNSSTPIGKENNRNCGNKATPFSTHNLTNHGNYSKPSVDTIDTPDTICQLPTVPLTPTSLTFSPLKLSSKNNATNMLQPIDDFFATPSIKAPLTTGRVIFSTNSRQKQRQPEKLKSDYQKTLFTTPQSIVNRQTSSNTSDYGTDSFNSIKKSSFISVLSPIDEEKISIDDFQVLCVNDDGTALANKVIEINGKEFILKKKIGCGGSCLVYSAKCKGNGTDRALKVVNLRADANSVESYLNEAKLLERLQGNPCVIRLFEQ